MRYIVSLSFLFFIFNKTPLAMAQTNMLVNPEFQGLNGWTSSGSCLVQNGYIDMYWNCTLSQNIALQANTLYQFKWKIYSAGDGEDWESMRLNISNCDPNRIQDFFIKDGWNDLGMSIRPGSTRTCKFSIQQMATYPAQYADEAWLSSFSPPSILPTSTPDNSRETMENIETTNKYQLLSQVFFGLSSFGMLFLLVFVVRKKKWTLS
jgi:hypothetical protein